MAKPLSKNTIDNEARKFQEDEEQNVAVNIVSTQLEEIKILLNSSAVVGNIDGGFANSVYTP